ncbi:putative RNA-directed DNA polymerase [Tanacetum coccineum]|uniref:RNA-directed DNA polymerase n=1 Tax=Tanacetum coccineum TaxID=301880 RepID=A0ABQ5CGY4_9ASTR
MVTIRCLISMSVNQGWPLFQLDVNNAFLYGNLTEDVYITLPLGYFSMDYNKVCKLVKSLYRLKQAPRQWNEKPCSVILENGFQQSKSDYSLFIKAKNNVYIALLVYVDDIVITGNNLDELACKPASTPIESKLVIIDKPINKKDMPLKNITEYQKLLGKLIYLTHTRPDISYVVHSLSQFMHSPLTSHLKLDLRVLKYLKNAPRKGIHISKINSLVLIGYVDSDWAKCKATRRSVTGFSVFFGKPLVSWKSKKQTIVSRSLAEAEYRALATVTCEIMWLLNLLRDFKLEIEKHVLIFCDNKAALQIAVNPVFHDRTKHFEIDLHFVRGKIIEGIIKPLKIESTNNLADMFTKGLSADQLTFLLEGLNMSDPFKNLN